MTRALIVVTIAFLQATAALSQIADPEVKRLGEKLDDCFENALAVQIEARQMDDVDVMSERSFVACSAEQRDIAVFLNDARSMSTDSVSTFLINIKRELKNKAWRIAAQSRGVR